MHEQVNEGDLLTISPPLNHFPLAPEAGQSLLLAGGIGVTPILCMAERLAQAGALFEMHYATRSRERTPFFNRIGKSGFASRVQFHFDDGEPAQKLDLPALLDARARHPPLCLRPQWIHGRRARDGDLQVHWSNFVFTSGVAMILATLE